MISVSVIIPAYNMATLLSQTLQSLLEQTFEQWEAIVIDDGSSDGTAGVIASFAKRDGRIQLVQQDNQGASAARNAGIALAQGDWFLFLDADDWILDRHLERMVAKLQADKTLDAVHCGWARVSPLGVTGPDNYAPDLPDMFDLFAQYCAFQPHACLVHRLPVHAVAGFETSLRSCQDWDFWQRIARTGARFGAVRESLARYRTRPGSISLNGFQVMADGLRVITQGHSKDERVPDPAHPFGRSSEQLASARLRFAAWPAGLVLGAGRDARPLLRTLEQDDHDPHLSPSHVAGHIFKTALLSLGRSQQEWAHLWPQIEDNVISFLEKLEQQSGAPGLAGRALRELEASIAGVLEKRPFKVGRTYAIELEVTSPLPQRLEVSGVNQLHCRLLLAGNTLGAINLPLPGSLVSRTTLADVISCEHAWPILGHFFEHTVYPELRLQQDDDAHSLWRGELCLARELPSAEELSWPEIHHDIGWTVFLQEVWGRPSWPDDSFYDPHHETTSASSVYSISGKLQLEVSDNVPDVVTHHQNITITATVGGATLGQVTLPVTNRMLKAQEIRAAVTDMADFDLCRLAVRQALIGRPPGAPPSLRARLRQAATVTSLKTKSTPKNHGSPGPSSTSNPSSASDLP